MVAAHLALGMPASRSGPGTLAASAHWVRQLEIVLISLAGIVTAAHGVAIWVADPWKELGVVLAAFLPILIVVPVLTFLLLPGTAVLFRDSTPDARVARRKRPWWMLSLQWIGASWFLPWLWESSCRQPWPHGGGCPGCDPLGRGNSPLASCLARLTPIAWVCTLDLQKTPAPCELIGVFPRVNVALDPIH